MVSNLVERLLAFLFPLKPYKIKTPDEAKQWFQYEVSNHPDLDPFRPLGFFDSWAGHVKEKKQEIANYYGVPVEWVQTHEEIHRNASNLARRRHSQSDLAATTARR
jgi:hypothetical protein